MSLDNNGTFFNLVHESKTKSPTILIPKLVFKFSKFIQFENAFFNIDIELIFSILTVLKSLQLVKAYSFISETPSPILIISTPSIFLNKWLFM